MSAGGPQVVQGVAALNLGVGLSDIHLVAAADVAVVDQGQVAAQA